MSDSEKIISLLYKNRSLIKNKLPYLFRMAEIESSRAGKIGMEVGNLREKIIIAMFYYLAKRKNVNAEIPTTKKQTDVIIYGQPISIKTITSQAKNGEISGIKISWTVDWEKVDEFIKTYQVQTDILIIQINWEKKGGLYYIPQEIQKKVLLDLRHRFFKKPKPGTNPRGIEISKKAMIKMIADPKSLTIEIPWEKQEINYDPYERWINLWKDNHVKENKNK